MATFIQLTIDGEPWSFNVDQIVAVTANDAEGGCDIRTVLEPDLYLVEQSYPEIMDALGGRLIPKRASDS